MFDTFFDFLGTKNPKKNFGIGRKQKLDFRITNKQINIRIKNFKN